MGYQFPIVSYGDRYCIEQKSYEYKNGVWLDNELIIPEHHWKFNENSGNIYVSDSGSIPKALVATGKENKNVNFYGKIAKFPKNVKAHKAYNFLENIKISKSKLWYFIIEKDNMNNEEDLQLIKYNNKEGVNCQKFVETLKEYYSKNNEIYQYIEKLKIEGNENFSVIRNIPNVEVNGKKLISIITEDLIKLLYK